MLIVCWNKINRWDRSFNCETHTQRYLKSYISKHCVVHCCTSCTRRACVRARSHYHKLARAHDEYDAQRKFLLIVGPAYIIKEYYIIL